MGKKTLGILGGMGPQATADLFQRIIDLTKAEKDQEHMDIIIEDLPQIPDRIGAILGDAESPFPKLLAGARNLERAGAEVIVMPCITAHYYWKDLKDAISVPFLNMLDVAASASADRFGKATAGILCSAATNRTGLMADALQKQGIPYLVPEEAQQQEISEIILAVKAKQPTEPLWQRMLPIIRSMQERGAAYFVLACTELPILGRGRTEAPLIDSTSELAAAAIRACGYETV